MICWESTQKSLQAGHGDGFRIAEAPVSLQLPTTYAATEAAIFGSLYDHAKTLVGACVVALPAAAPVGVQTTPPSYNTSIGIDGSRGVM